MVAKNETIIFKTCHLPEHQIVLLTSILAERDSNMTMET
jgi:hypothetical protein